MSLSPNTTLAQYTIISKIGEGGMGEVWRARDTKLGRDVAIKVLPSSLSENTDRLSRFEQEAQAAGALNHPNILVIYHIGTHDSAPYIVSELLEGETLRDRMAGAALPQRKAIDYSLQIARGLAAAHDKGIVHRDIKPENIFITHDGRVKILDFGLAKLRSQIDIGQRQTDVSTRKVNTDPGTVMGTIGYMSPEQLKGRPADNRSDIFSFGAVLYEVLAGKRAFRGDSTPETMSAILREDPPDLSETNKTISPGLERIVRHCLEKNPAERFHSASDLAFALEALSSLSTAADQSGQITGGFNPASYISVRPRWLSYLALAVILALITALVVFVFRFYPQRSVESRVVRFPIVLPEKTWFAIDVEQHNVSISPNGRWVAFVADSEGKRRVYVRSLDQLEVRPLPGTDRAYSPFWSPDSRFIAFFAEGKLRRVEATGGPVQTICDVPARDTAGSWGADGTIIFMSYREKAPGVLYQVNAAGGSPVATLERADLELLWVSFLPNSRNFVFYAESATSQPEGIYSGTLGSKEVKLITKVPRTRVEYAAPGYLIYVREGSIVAQSFDPKNLTLSGEPKVIVEHIAYFDQTGYAEFSVSEAGVLVYPADFAMSKLAWLDRTGREVGTVGDKDRFGYVRLSLDGKKVAVTIGDPQTSSGDIWIYDLNGSRNRFVFGPPDEGEGVWSPDGRRFAYFTSAGPSTLRIKDVADANSIGESPIDSGFISPTDWSRDGRYLICSINDPTVQRDLWVLLFEGDRKPVPFLQTQFSEWGARFSPDGKFVAYNSDESGTTEVYVARFDKPTERVRISTSGGINPRWRRDGRELFYVAADGQLTSVSFFDSSPPKVETPTALFGAFDVTEFDVSLDGQRFLVVKGVEGIQAAPLHVMLNWAGRIKRQMITNKCLL